MRFYVGQLLKLDFGPRAFRVLTITEDRTEIIKYSGDPLKDIWEIPLWSSKAGWRDAHLS